MQKKRIKSISVSILIITAFTLFSQPLRVFSINNEVPQQANKNINAVLDKSDKKENVEIKQEEKLEAEQKEEAEVKEAEKTDGEVKLKEKDKANGKKSEAELEALNPIRQYKTNRFIVKYKNETDNERLVNGIKDKVKVKAARKIKNKRLNVIVTNDKMAPADFIEQVKQNKLDDDIEYIQPDYQVQLSSNDAYFNKQWAMGKEDLNNTTVNSANTDQSIIENITTNASVSGDTTTGASISEFSANVASAWKSSQGDGVIVAVLDTGIDITHEDLAENIWTNEKEIAGNNVDDDGNGIIDDIHGWNFYDNNNIVHDPSLAYDEGHGTHVAGIIGAAINNNKGIAGVAPKVKIMPLKVFSNGQAYTSEIIDAIDYATKMGAKIANCSWGSTSNNLALNEAIDNSGMLFVTASGNDAMNIDTNPIYPASFENGNIISVASIKESGALSSFSNYGTTSVDVAAPGENILSTLPNNSYGESSGTSMSAAFVSGEAALILSKYGNMTASELKKKIIDSSDTVSLLQDKIYQGNIIDCANAVLYDDLTNKKIITLTKDQVYSPVQNSNETKQDFTLFSTGFWSGFGYMQTPRYTFGSAAVNGKLYAIGGRDSSFSLLNDVEVYDPTSNTWTTKAAMPTPRAKLATAVVNGKVYAIGGNNDATQYPDPMYAEEYISSVLDTVEIYDPVLNTWTTGAPLPIPCYSAEAAVVNGKIYVIGGLNRRGVMGFYMEYGIEDSLNTVQVYDPSTNTWSIKTSMPAARYSFGIGAVNGKIYAMGGYLYSEGYYMTNRIEQYDIATDTWTSVGNMPTAEAEFGTTVVNNKIYTAGGITGNDSVLNTVQEYDPSTASWVFDQSMSTPREQFGFGAIGSNLYSFGGYSGTSVVNSPEKAPITPASDDYGNDSSSAASMTIGNQIPAAINYAGDVDFFKFTPIFSGTYIIGTTGTTDTYGYLYDSNQNQLAYNDDSNGSLNFSISYSLIANQTYYIKVRHWSSSGTGSYSLAVKDSVGNDFNSATVIQAGSNISAAIEYAGDFDFFKFTPTVSGSYTICTTGTTDTYGYLYDVNQNQLAYNDDSNGTTNFTIRYALIANQTYYIKIRHYYSFGTGAYSFSISQVQSSQTYTITTSKQSFNLLLTASSVDDFNKHLFTVNFNPSVVAVDDLCSMTPTKDIATGNITGTSINVVKYDPVNGIIQFTVSQSINSGKIWSGPVNTILFKALTGGTSTITYTVQ
ncbi:S8 family serine peptidase [Clostridium sp. DJ247]|uniref:S8 family serine peptidase n=1 Tax=Clostridium sp. DJ247 TaxID=2726188 RepID=UPI00162A3510|nr:S8 family serine peptidase [Clostridium sp. DJ247]MBC2581761.1 S8 family serine peptidase [Clostridium sp. DJ247]